MSITLSFDSSKKSNPFSSVEEFSERKEDAIPAVVHATTKVFNVFLNNSSLDNKLTVENVRSLKKLRDQNSNFKEEDQANFLTIVEGWNFNLINALLKKGNISGISMGKALELSSSSGSSLIVRLLLQQEVIPTVSSPTVQSSLQQEVIPTGSFSAVRLLLQGENTPIPEEWLTRAVDTAVEKKHFRIVKIFLDLNLERFISSKAREWAVKYFFANSNGQVELLEKLLGSGPLVSDLYAGKVLKALSQESGDVLEMVRGLLSHNTIPINDIKDAVLRASKAGNRNVVRELYFHQTSELSNNERLEAIQAAAETLKGIGDGGNRILGIICILFESEDIEGLFQRASREDLLPLFQILLQHGNISDTSRQIAFEAASQNGQTEMIDALKRESAFRQRALEEDS